MRWMLVFALIEVLAACGPRHLHAPASVDNAAIEPDYLDLQAGWRLKVVTPILKSGGYRLATSQGANNADRGNLKAGPDFVGYENSYYSITKSGAGIRIAFRSAEIVKDGETTPQPSSLISLFNLPAFVHHVRLIFLVRVSDADHNMAIVGAATPATLTEMTLALKNDPATPCRIEAQRFCSWVPAGVAVRAEEQQSSDGEKQWAPAR